MASADLLRREEEFYSSLFDSAKGNACTATLSDGDADFAPKLGGTIFAEIVACGRRRWRQVALTADREED
jgi:hypothetical protein